MGPAPTPPTPHPLDPPSPSIRTLTLSGLDLAAGSLAWAPLRPWQSCAGGRVAPLVSPLHVIIRPAPLPAAPVVRGARLVAFHRTHSTAPCPPRPNKGRAPKLATAARTVARGLHRPRPPAAASHCRGFLPIFAVAALATAGASNDHSAGIHCDEKVVLVAKLRIAHVSL
jgi:hypothetical protein